MAKSTYLKTPAVKTKRQKKRSRRSERPTIRFTPYSWSKLLYLRDLGSTEIAAFGISHPTDLLLVEDICLVNQQCTAVTVEFDEASVAEFFDDQINKGRTPDQFARIWIHTHPGHSPRPSKTDEHTFTRCFGAVDWAVMFIVAAGGKTYARLQHNTGPKSSQRIHVDIDYTVPFAAASINIWHEEHRQHVTAIDPFDLFHGSCLSDPSDDTPSDRHQTFQDHLAEEWYQRAEAEDLFLNEDPKDHHPARPRYLAAVS